MSILYKVEPLRPISISVASKEIPFIDILSAAVYPIPCLATTK